MEIYVHHFFRIRCVSFFETGARELDTAVDGELERRESRAAAELQELEAEVERGTNARRCFLCF